MFTMSLWLNIVMMSAIVLVNAEGTDSQGCKPPKFRQTAADTTQPLVVLTGHRVVLACDVEGRQRDLTILWGKDGRRLFHGGRVHLKGRGKYLKITKTRKDDAGNYSCEGFTNSLLCGSSQPIKRTFHLVVVKEEETKEKMENRRLAVAASPTFTIKTAQTFFAIPVGSSIKLDCSSTGSVPLFVRWSKDGAPASLKYKRLPYFRLRLSKVVPGDAGEYTCNVSNAHGWINHTYKLHVQERLRAKPIVLPISNTTVWVSENITVTCLALSDFMPHFQWIRWFPSQHRSTTLKRRQASMSYEVLHERPKEVVMEPVTSEVRAGAFEFTGIKLTLLNVTAKQQGRYTCVVGNAIGFTTKDVYATVLEKIGPNGCSGAVDGYYPHATDCSKFVVCEAGVTSQKHCPSGLLWNKHRSFCDWPKDVTC